jgi:predicted PurR-regulated permease PerM
MTELAGVAGAFLAVPLLVVMQIVGREWLAARRAAP